MRLGLVSDLHGNFPALEAVLAQLEGEQLDRIVCLGDVCFGPQVHECLEIVRELGCPVVLGNWDSWSVGGFPATDDPVAAKLQEIGAWWAESLTDSDRAFVATFRRTLELPLDDGRRILCFHGSPRSFSDLIFATTPDDELEAMFAGTTDAAILVGGHTHLQMLRRLPSALFVNPGSVGQPFSQWWPREIRVAPWAEYAVVDTGAQHSGVELRRVPYDLDRLLGVLAGSRMPHRQWWLDSWRPT